MGTVLCRPGQFKIGFPTRISPGQIYVGTCVWTKPNHTLGYEMRGYRMAGTPDTKAKWSNLFNFNSFLRMCWTWFWWAKCIKFDLHFSFSARTHLRRYNYGSVTITSSIFLYCRKYSKSRFKSQLTYRCTLSEANVKNNYGTSDIYHSQGHQQRYFVILSSCKILMILYK